MTVNMAPSKFDICLISGFLFNFACVTANYWPSMPPNRSPSQSPYSPSMAPSSAGYYGGGGGGGYPGGPSSMQSPLVSSPLLRVHPGYNGQIMRGYGGSPYGSSSSSPSYPPNYSYSPLPSHYNYPNTGPPPVLYPPVPPSAASSLNPGTSASISSYSQRFPPFYKPDPYGSVPMSYWRNPPLGAPGGHGVQSIAAGNENPYDAFDRRTGPYPVMDQGPYGSPLYPSPMYEPFYPRGAVAKLKSKSSKVEGEVRFVQQDARFVGITGRVVGLVPGAHGLHVHESREKDAEEGTCDMNVIGGHFNPTSSNHGGKSDWVRHVGDLGNIFADADGIAYFSITDPLISLTGPHSIVNRTLVVTEFGDDLGKGTGKETTINGNAGKPVACGVVHSAIQLL